MKLHPKKLPRSVAPSRKMHLVAAALLVASACSKPSAKQTPASEMTEVASTAQQAITEGQVRAIANEIREANLQLDVERFVAPLANDAEIIFVPLNGKTAVMEREIIKPYLESV